MDLEILFNIVVMTIWHTLPAFLMLALPIAYLIPKFERWRRRRKWNKLKQNTTWCQPPHYYIAPCHVCNGPATVEEVLLNPAPWMWPSVRCANKKCKNKTVIRHPNLVSALYLWYVKR